MGGNDELGPSTARRDASVIRYAILSGIRTTLDIDDRLLEALMARSPGLSKTKAIERAIDHYVKTDVYESIRGLRGAFPEMADFSTENRRLDLERQERP